MLWHEGIASCIGSYHVAWGQTRALYYNSDLTLSQSFQPMAVQKAVLSLAASAQRAHASCRTIFCLEDIDYSVWCSYNAVSFLQSPRELPINRPLWWIAVCLLWVQANLPQPLQCGMQYYVILVRFIVYWILWATNNKTDQLFVALTTADAVPKPFFLRVIGTRQYAILFNVTNTYMQLVAFVTFILKH